MTMVNEHLTTSKRMEKYKLTLHREVGRVGLAIPMTVEINEGITAKLPAGTKSSFEVDYKPTRLHITCTSLGRTLVDQTIMVDPSGFKDLTVRLRWTSKGSLSWKGLTLQALNEAIKYEVLYGERRSGAPSEPKYTPRQGTTKFCPQCGQPVAPGSKFCSNCGAKL